MKDQFIWEPSPQFIERTNVRRLMRRLGLATYQDFVRYSQEHLEEFWDEIALEVGIDWNQAYYQVLDTSKGNAWARWFLNGKLNIAWNCLDRHSQGPSAGRTACIWEGEDGAIRTLTFQQLRAEVDQLAAALRGLGLEKGDRVALYMPMIPEVVVILYACFKLGLIAVPIFSGFGFGAAAACIEDSGARVLFTADSVERRGRLLPLKEKADAALQRCPSVERVIVYRYKGGVVDWTADRDIWWNDFVSGKQAAIEALPMDSEDAALLLYTSGTTGKAKGVVHTHAGALVQTTKEIYLAFDHKPDDVFFWVSDIGWMMGPWEIIGNHHPSAPRGAGDQHHRCAAALGPSRSAAGRSGERADQGDGAVAARPGLVAAGGERRAGRPHHSRRGQARLGQGRWR